MHWKKYFKMCYRSHLSSNYFPRCTGFCVFLTTGKFPNVINPRLVGRYILNKEN